MRLFLKKNQDINSAENIALATLWNFTYNNKHNDEKKQGIPFAYWLKKCMANLTALPPPLSLSAGYIHKVLNSEIWNTRD